MRTFLSYDYLPTLVSSGFNHLYLVDYVVVFFSSRCGSCKNSLVTSWVAIVQLFTAIDRPFQWILVCCHPPGWRRKWGRCRVHPTMVKTTLFVPRCVRPNLNPHVSLVSHRSPNIARKGTIEERGAFICPTRAQNIKGSQFPMVGCAPVCSRVMSNECSIQQHMRDNGT